MLGGPLAGTNGSFFRNCFAIKIGVFNKLD